MPGTSAGGKKAAAKNLEKNPNHYRDMGRRGGKNKTGPTGFALMDKEAVREIGRKGGTISKRRPRDANP